MGSGQLDQVVDMGGRRSSDGRRPNYVRKMMIDDIISSVPLPENVDIDELIEKLTTCNQATSYVVITTDSSVVVADMLNLKGIESAWRRMTGLEYSYFAGVLENLYPPTAGKCQVIISPGLGRDISVPRTRGNVLEEYEVITVRGGSEWDYYTKTIHDFDGEPNI